MRRKPGEVRDAIVQVLDGRPHGATVQEITSHVVELIGDVPPSSVRSYLRLNTPAVFARSERAQYSLAGVDIEPASTGRLYEQGSCFRHGKAALYLSDCMEWLAGQPPNSVHAVVTDPPYGLVEYSEGEQEKLRAGKGGVWRIPPSFDGAKRSPLPRFTVLKPYDLGEIERFFRAWATGLSRVLVPGANVVVASNPLLSYLISGALTRGGL